MDELEELAVVIDRDWRVVWSDMYSIPPGNVGIGTTEMDAKLDVVNESDGPAIEGRSEADLSSGSKYGARFFAMNDGGYNIGVYGTAGCELGGDPADVNIGVWGIFTEGMIINPSGDWGGWFQGDVKVTDNLVYSFFIDKSDGGRDFVSDWLSVSPGGTRTVSHNLGGYVEKYIVYLDGKNSNGIHQSNYGTAAFGTIEKKYGCEWHSLTTSSIKVTRAQDDDEASQPWEHFRVRIRYNH
jgi:hypothetical protein